MFKKILVALDHSSQASTVLNSAISLAQTGITEILLVHFVDWQMQNASHWVGMGTLYDVDLFGERYDWSRQRLQTEVDTVNDWLKKMSKKVYQSNINCKYICHVGNCNLGISDCARDWGAELIVVGRRGHNNISEIFLGSVSNHVIHHAPCSVMVVQGSKTPQTDIDKLPAVNQVSSYPSQI